MSRPTSVAAAAALPRRAPQITQLHLPHGPRLELALQGPPAAAAAATVLLLHGGTDTWRSFEPVLPHLPGDWHVVSLTQRGHGGSAETESYRTADFAADAAAVIEALGLAPAVVVGHSMGAANAMRLAIERPALVRGLVAAGAFASFGDKDELRAFVSDVHRIAAPTLLPWGDADLFVPEEDQQRIVREIVSGGGQIERAVYKGTGHALHWEQPERFARDLVRFVARLPGSRSKPVALGTTASRFATLN